MVTSDVTRPAAQRSLAPSRWLGALGYSISVLLPAALLAALALIPQPPYGPDPYHDVIRRHAIVILSLAIFAGLLLIRRQWPRATGFELPFVLLLAVQAAAVFAAAQDRRIGLEPTLDLLAAILLFYAFVRTPGLPAASLRRALMLMAVVLAVAALRDVWQQWHDWLGWLHVIAGAGGSILPPTVPRVLNVGTNPNILAPMMTLTAPLFFLSLICDRGLTRIAVAAGLGIVQIAIFFTLSRSAWIGEAAGLVVGGLGLWLAAGASRIAFRRLATATAILACIVGALFGVLLVRGYRPLWLFRSSLAARSDFRSAAVEIIRAHPLLGAGPGSFAVLYPLVSEGDPFGAVHSHNVILQIMVDSGIIGLLAFALVGGTAVLVLWRLWRSADRWQRLVAAAVAASYLSFAVNGMADALHLFPELLAMLAALTAIAIRTAQEQTQPDLDRAPVRLQKLARLVGPALAVCLLVAVGSLSFVWLRIDRAEASYDRSIYQASQGRWTDAADEAEQAIALDPTMPVYHVQAGISLDMAGGAAPIPGEQDRAISELQEALTTEPRSGVTRLDLAILLTERGRTSEASALLPEIVRDDPRDPTVLLGVGVLQEQLQPGEAVETYALALAQNPRLADSPFWQSDDFRRAHAAEIVAQALAVPDAGTAGSTVQTVREIIRNVSDPTDEDAEPPPGSDFLTRVDHAQALIRNGDYADARTILTSAVSERPDDPSARLALGKLDAAVGDLPGARRQWIAGAYLGDAASIVALGDSMPAGQVPARVQVAALWALGDMRQRQVSLIAQDYRFAFRRREPAPALLPGPWFDALPRVYFDADASLARWHGTTSEKGP